MRESSVLARPSAGRARSGGRWKRPTVLSIAVGVAFSVVLMSVAFGVERKIGSLVSNPVVQTSHLVDVGQIKAILYLLTAVITSAMLLQTALTTCTLATSLMHSRRHEIAVRRQNGVFRSTLLWEFVRTLAGPCLVGGIAGESVGILAAVLLERLTVLPVHFTLVSLLSAFPVTVALAFAATLVPAWRVCGMSPATVRGQ